jgi:hypothetical protein
MIHERKDKYPLERQEAFPATADEFNVNNPNAVLARWQVSARS